MNLKDWMTTHNWTVAALAVELGMSEATIWRWRTQDTMPRLLQLALEGLGNGEQRAPVEEEEATE